MDNRRSSASLLIIDWSKSTSQHWVGQPSPRQPANAAQGAACMPHQEYRAWCGVVRDWWRIWTGYSPNRHDHPRQPSSHRHQRSPHRLRYWFHHCRWPFLQGLSAPNRFHRHRFYSVQHQAVHCQLDNEAGIDNRSAYWDFHPPSKSPSRHDHHRRHPDRL